MAEFPALPLWTDAYLGDTTHLSGLQHGAYLLLLITAWRTRDCTLPDDDKKLAKFARVTPAQWARLRPVIVDFWTVRDGKWFNNRLSDERATVSLATKKRSDAGRASALKRLNRDGAMLERSVTPRSAPTPTPTPTPTESSSIEVKISKLGRIGKLIGRDLTIDHHEGARWIRQILDFEAKGFDFDSDILAGIKARCARPLPGDAIKTLMFFQKSIEEIKSARSDASAILGARVAAEQSPEGQMKVRKRVENFVKAGWWFPDEYGPSPCDSGCTVPAAVLEEFRLIWNQQGQHPLTNSTGSMAWFFGLASFPNSRPFFGDNVIVLKARA